MSHLNSCDKNQKITNFTTKITRKLDAKNTLKRPISPSSIIVDERESKRQVTNNSINSPAMANDNTSTSKLSSFMKVEDNTALKNALGLLITEFRLLRESVETVHHDYADLNKQFLNKRKSLNMNLLTKLTRIHPNLLRLVMKTKFSAKRMSS